MSEVEVSPAPATSAEPATPPAPPRAATFPPGSERNPYRLVIVGGGPAGTFHPSKHFLGRIITYFVIPPSSPIGCAIIVRAIRLGMFSDLSSQVETAAGVCLIDASDLDRFGGGRLQDYMINSNTFGRKFVSNVVDDMPGMLPPETVADTPLESLRDSCVGQSLETGGDKPAPLTAVGTFLKEVGGVVYQVLREHCPASKCLLNTKVVRVQRCQDRWQVTVVDDETALQQDVFTLNVCLATGGKQEVPWKTLSSSHAFKVVFFPSSCFYFIFPQTCHDLTRNLL